MANLRVLLADNDSYFRNNAQQALTRQGYFVIPAATSTDALARLKTDAVDVVVADVVLPPHNGLEVMRATKARTPVPPVLLLTEPQTINMAAMGVREGAFDYLVKPLDDFMRLALTIERMVGHAQAETNLDGIELGPVTSPGELASARFLTAATAGQDLETLLTRYAAEFGQLAHATHTLVLLMPPNAQLRLTAWQGYTNREEAARGYVKANGEDFSWNVIDARDLIWRDAPIISDGEKTEMLGLPFLYAKQILGVTLAFANTPREAVAPATRDALRQLAQQVTLAIELDRQRTLAEKRNPLDAATSLLNREHFMEQADRAFRRSWRFNEPIGALVLDVDDYPRLQQLLGSEEGATLMRRIAGNVYPQLRSVDLIGRLDESRLGAIILMGTREYMSEIAERLRRAVAEIEITLPEPEGARQITASIGFATYPREKCSSVHDLFNLAGSATRASRNTGRNRVVGV